MLENPGLYQYSSFLKIEQSMITSLLAHYALFRIINTAERTNTKDAIISAEEINC